MENEKQSGADLNSEKDYCSGHSGIEIGSSNQRVPTNAETTTTTTAATTVTAVTAATATAIKTTSDGQSVICCSSVLLLYFGHFLSCWGDKMWAFAIAVLLISNLLDFSRVSTRCRSGIFFTAFASRM